MDMESGERRAALSAKPSTPCSSRYSAVLISRDDSSVTCSALEPVASSSRKKEGG